MTLSDLDPPNSYRISGEGSGGVAGFAKGGASVRLESESPDVTVLHYNVEAQIGGKFAQLGARLIDSTARKLAGEFFESFAAVVGGKERIRAFGKMQSPPRLLSDQQIEELHPLKTRHYERLIGQHTCRLRPGVEAFIRGALARGQKLAIATTTTLSNVEGLLSATLDRDWRNLFAAGVAGDDVPRKKPAPDVYLEVLARLGPPASQSLAVEDSANGLEAALATGVPVLITRSELFRDDDFSSALAVVDELTEAV